MKRFRFPLRSVAVLRAHRELRAQEAFAAAVHAYMKAEADLTAARARVAQLADALSARRRERFAAANEAQSLAAYRRECAAELEAGRATKAARDAMQQRRLEYLDAHRKVEVVKRLEEKARASHRAAANREEQVEFDDFANGRFGRRSLFTA